MGTKKNQDKGCQQYSFKIDSIYKKIKAVENDIFERVGVKFSNSLKEKKEKSN